MFCSECGKEISNTDKFCNSCGKEQVISSAEDKGINETASAWIAKKNRKSEPNVSESLGQKIITKPNPANSFKFKYRYLFLAAIAFAVIKTNFYDEPSKPVTPEEKAIADAKREQRDRLGQASVIASGYRCPDPVSVTLNYDGSFRIMCDDDLLTYIMKEDLHTGKVTVEPD
ncbi:TPA: zinc ribbon domain-containing protein [Yersinia enterocolitica]|nr:zinc ribbon domain-containing protein [Yersinia enterocolitica]